MFFLYFFSGRPQSNEFSGNTGWIFTDFSGMVELCKSMINFAFIWQSLKGSCRGNQQKSKIGVFRRRIFFVMLPLQKGLEYWNGSGSLEAH